MELVNGLRNGKFNLLKALFRHVFSGLLRNFGHHLRHDHDTNVIPAQLPMVFPHFLYQPL